MIPLAQVNDKGQLVSAHGELVEPPFRIRRFPLQFILPSFDKLRMSGAVNSGDFAPAPAGGRGGFVTRPTFNDKQVLENGSAVADLFLHPSQGGL